MHIQSMHSQFKRLPDLCIQDAMHSLRNVAPASHTHAFDNSVISRRACSSVSQCQECELAPAAITQRLSAMWACKETLCTHRCYFFPAAAFAASTAASGMLYVYAC